MATSQAAPANSATQITTDYTAFDLTSMSEVQLRKVGSVEPVSTMEEFVARMGNDAKAILEIVNDGLVKYTERNLANDASVAWQQVDEDEAGAETLVPFTGALINPEVEPGFKKTVTDWAKMLFGYKKSLSPELKREAKDKARKMLLSNPAVVEGLRSK